MSATVWTIYCHTNQANGKHYVGLTKKTMARRWVQHVQAAIKNYGACVALKAAILKYGGDAWDHLVLETCSSLDDANAAEQWWIAELRSNELGFGYNLNAGGTTRGTSEETRRRLGDAARARWASYSPEQRDAISRERASRWSGLTPEQRSDRVRQMQSGISLERRRAYASESQDPAKHRAAALARWDAMTADQRDSFIRSRAASILAKTTPEQRSEKARAAWVTRRAKAAQNV